MSSLESKRLFYGYFCEVQDANNYKITMSFTASRLISLHKRMKLVLKRVPFCAECNAAECNAAQFVIYTSSMVNLVSNWFFMYDIWK